LVPLEGCKVTVLGGASGGERGRWARAHVAGRAAAVAAGGFERVTTASLDGAVAVSAVTAR
jgi:hypothetical protein